MYGFRSFINHRASLIQPQKKRRARGRSGSRRFPTSASISRTRPTPTRSHSCRCSPRGPAKTSLTTAQTRWGTITRAETITGPSQVESLWHGKHHVNYGFWMLDYSSDQQEGGGADVLERSRDQAQGQVQLPSPGRRMQGQFSGREFKQPFLTAHSNG